MLERVLAAMFVRIRRLPLILSPSLSLSLFLAMYVSMQVISVIISMVEQVLGAIFENATPPTQA